DVQATLLDTAHFSSRGRGTAVLDRLGPPLRQDFAPFENHFSSGLVNSDPPHHAPLRALGTQAFAPTASAALRPRIQQLVDGLLDAAVARGRLDVIWDFAYPLPAIVIAEILGVPPETRDDFRRWSDSILSFQGAGVVSAELLDKVQTDLVEM